MQKLQLQTKGGAMKTRLAIYDLAVRYQLDFAAIERLRQLAGLEGEPPALARRLPLLIAAMGALLLGLGIVSGVAANWQQLARTAQFTILQLAVLLPCVGCVLWPALRLPLAFLTVLATGALLAFLGQTYQTGADPWQLFAFWSVLIFPLCAYVRHDVLWSVLILLLLMALKLWMGVQPQDDGSMRMRTGTIAWSIMAAMYVAAGPLWAAGAGTGIYSRLAVVAGLFMLCSLAWLSGIYHSPRIAEEGSAPLILLGICWSASGTRSRDWLTACAAGFCFCSMVVLLYAFGEPSGSLNLESTLLSSGLCGLLTVTAASSLIVWRTKMLAEVRDE
jgi:hypothetical protein